eukprot:scaffold1070_cov245-Pinguiococcus_pyrenoidosus.AAC.24
MRRPRQLQALRKLMPRAVAPRALRAFGDLPPPCRRQNEDEAPVRFTLLYRAKSRPELRCVRRGRVFRIPAQALLRFEHCKLFSAAPTAAALVLAASPLNFLLARGAVEQCRAPATPKGREFRPVAPNYKSADGPGVAGCASGASDSPCRCARQGESARAVGGWSRARRSLELADAVASAPVHGASVRLWHSCAAAGSVASNSTLATEFYGVQSDGTPGLGTPRVRTETTRWSSRRAVSVRLGRFRNSLSSVKTAAPCRRAAGSPTTAPAGWWSTCALCRRTSSTWRCVRPMWRRIWRTSAERYSERWRRRAARAPAPPRDLCNGCCRRWRSCRIGSRLTRRPTEPSWGYVLPSSLERRRLEAPQSRAKRQSGASPLHRIPKFGVFGPMKRVRRLIPTTRRRTAAWPASTPWRRTQMAR